jgi:cobalamin biosynthesis protein CobT
LDLGGVEGGSSKERAEKALQDLTDDELAGLLSKAFSGAGSPSNAGEASNEGKGEPSESGAAPSDSSPTGEFTPGGDGGPSSSDAAPKPANERLCAKDLTNAQRAKLAQVAARLGDKQREAMQKAAHAMLQRALARMQRQLSDRSHNAHGKAQEIDGTAPYDPNDDDPVPFEDLEDRTDLHEGSAEEGLPEGLESEPEDATEEELDKILSSLNDTNDNREEDDPETLFARNLEEAYKRGMGMEAAFKAPAVPGSINIYESVFDEVVDLLNDADERLKGIFDRKKGMRAERFHSGGVEVDISRRITEIAAGRAVTDSRSWREPRLPVELDYAVGVLVDMSGSMFTPGDMQLMSRQQMMMFLRSSNTWRDTKIHAALKGGIVISESLSRFGLPVEVLGFSDSLVEFKAFSEKLDSSTRSRIGRLVDRVFSGGTDLGWAVTMAYDRLLHQVARNKVLIVLSDGEPSPSRHGAFVWELKGVVSYIRAESKVSLIGVGVGPGTNHVADYFPDYVANVPVSELAAQLSEILAVALARNRR